MPSIFVDIFEADGYPRCDVLEVSGGGGERFIRLVIGPDLGITLPGLNAACVAYARQLVDQLTACADQIERAMATSGDGQLFNGQEE
jgi:hypothetical protein